MAVTVKATVTDYYAKLGSSVRPRREKPDLMVAEHACPHCAGLLGVEVYPDGFPGFPSPRIDGGTPEPLAITGT
jgi:hypothetical protein